MGPVWFSPEEAAGEQPEHMGSEHSYRSLLTCVPMSQASVYGRDWSGAAYNEKGDAIGQGSD